MVNIENFTKEMVVTKAEKKIRDQIEAYHKMSLEFSKDIEEARANGENVSDLEEITKILEEGYEKLSKKLDEFE